MDETMTAQCNPGMKHLGGKVQLRGHTMTIKLMSFQAMIIIALNQPLFQASYSTISENVGIKANTA